jgi:hypothetical protein
MMEKSKRVSLRVIVTSFVSCSTSPSGRPPLDLALLTRSLFGLRKHECQDDIVQYPHPRRLDPDPCLLFLQDVACPLTMTAFSSVVTNFIVCLSFEGTDETEVKLAWDTPSLTGPSPIYTGRCLAQ